LVTRERQLAKATGAKKLMAWARVLKQRTLTSALRLQAEERERRSLPPATASAAA
jgi:hypothetical protein